MKLFCKKTQNFRALGALPQNPQPPAAGGFAARPPKQPPLRIFGCAPEYRCQDT